MKTAKKAKQSKRPTYAQVVDQRDNLRRKVMLLREALAGEAARLDFDNACGIEGSDSPRERDIRRGALRWAAYSLDYVMQGEG